LICADTGGKLVVERSERLPLHRLVGWHALSRSDIHRWDRLERGSARPARRARAAVLAAVMLAGGLAGCGSGGSQPGPARTMPGQAGECPSAYRPPDPRRPEVDLSFDVEPDHTRVLGREVVVFTPDRPVDELVFRLWPNGPEGGRTSGRLDVTRADALGSGRFTLEPAGARPGTPGTLLHLRLPRQVPAGEAVTADLDFVLRLPNQAADDRLGRSATTAWWGSGYPLLAWERGHGWDREPASPLSGETAVSEAARLRLTVTAPAADTVLMPGVISAPPNPAGAGRRRWRSTASAVRDVAVAVGPFRLAASWGGVPVTAGVAPEVAESAQAVHEQVVRAVRSMADRFGPYPFEGLSVAVLPGIGDDGFEYPGVVLLGTANQRVNVPHEVAHQWFYGMVGNNQARDPWLDEAFATYAEMVVNGTGVRRRELVRPGPVGAPMSAFGDDDSRYLAVVYSKGAAALITARREVGPAAFDAALRCYVAANAWRIVVPADLARALAGLPAATSVLRRAGALTE